MIEINQQTFDFLFLNQWVGGYFKKDCDLIVKVIKEKFNITLTRWQAHELWDYHSGKRDAQWLNVNEDEIPEMFEEFIGNKAELFGME